MLRCDFDIISDTSYYRITSYHHIYSVDALGLGKLLDAIGTGTTGLTLLTDHPCSPVLVADDIKLFSGGFLVEKFDFNCDFGAINIDHVNIINGNGDYVSIRSKYVYQSGRFESDFGSLKIDELGKELKSLDIASDYTGIVLGLNPDNTFRKSPLC